MDSRTALLPKLLDFIKVLKKSGLDEEAKNLDTIINESLPDYESLFHFFHKIISEEHAVEPLATIIAHGLITYIQKEDAAYGAEEVLTLVKNHKNWKY